MVMGAAASALADWKGLPSALDQGTSPLALGLSWIYAHEETNGAAPSTMTSHYLLLTHIVV